MFVLYSRIILCFWVWEAWNRLSNRTLLWAELYKFCRVLIRVFLGFFIILRTFFFLLLLVINVIVILAPYAIMIHDQFLNYTTLHFHNQVWWLGHWHIHCNLAFQKFWWLNTSLVFIKAFLHWVHNNLTRKMLNIEHFSVIISIPCSKAPVTYFIFFFYLFLWNDVYTFFPTLKFCKRLFCYFKIKKT